MNNSRNTAGTLFLNILAMLLCASVFIGSTLAWYTLSVTDQGNKIQVGELDITIYDGTRNELVQTTEGEVTTYPVLFKDISWKPGTVAYENLTIHNDGSLAFDYEISLDVTGCNTVLDSSGADTDKSLKDVIKVALVEGHIDSSAEDNAVLNVVNTSGVDMNPSQEVDSKWASVDGLLYNGRMNAADTGETNTTGKNIAVVIYWEETSNDSDYNVSASDTSDGIPLYLNLGLQFEALQADVETDSFGNTYDAENVQSAVIEEDKS